jgi:hypothetical protein
MASFETPFQLWCFLKVFFQQPRKQEASVHREGFTTVLFVRIGSRGNTRKKQMP